MAAADRIERLKTLITEESQVDFSSELEVRIGFVRAVIVAQLLQVAERKYAQDPHPSADHNFSYATSLIRSRTSPQKMKKGMGILRGTLATSHSFEISNLLPRPVRSYPA